MQHPLRVGLLYSKGDAFGLKRSELLLGPSLLANQHLIRFTAEDIDSATLEVTGEENHHGQWRSVNRSALDVMIDVSIPKTERTAAERLLLASLTHIPRIDLDRFDILTLLAQDAELRPFMLAMHSLDQFSDLVAAQQAWEWVAIKACARQEISTTVIVGKDQSGWRVYRAYEYHVLTDEQIQLWIESHFLQGFFMQAYVHGVTKEQKSIAFNLVVQQRDDGAWRTPVVRGVLATVGPLASLRAGGEFVATPLFQEDHAYFDYPSLSKANKYLDMKLRRLAMVMAHRLVVLLNQPIGALGFKFTVDANLQPRLLTIQTRVSSQSGAGRHLEFYRHWVEFAAGLVRGNVQPVVIHSADDAIETDIAWSIPKQGYILRGLDNERLLSLNQSWIHLGLGFSGRAMLLGLNQTGLLARSFLSIRLGYGLTDYLPTGKNISALDDYLGSGILNWSESELMRSIRLPLLEKQWQQLSPFLDGKVPELIWLEEADLGLMSIEKQDAYDALTTVANWFEGMCQQGAARRWGISVFNVHNGYSATILDWLEQCAHGYACLCVLGVNMPKLDRLLVDQLSRFNLQLVLISSHISLQEVDDLPKVSLLSVYNTVEEA